MGENVENLGGVPPSTRTEEEQRPSSVPGWLRRAYQRSPAKLREWLGDPDFSIFFLVFMVLTAALYLRMPKSTGGGFVFDEQEAILANGYVRGKSPWLTAFQRDFWGYKANGSIGSYRPIPNLLWRALWRVQEQAYNRMAILSGVLAVVGVVLSIVAFTGREVDPVTKKKENDASFYGTLAGGAALVFAGVVLFIWKGSTPIPEGAPKGTPMNTPFVWFNLVFHATNAALLATLVRGLLKRVGVAWLAAGIFCTCAVLTEAISGIVGIADVLGGLSILLALAALRLNRWAVPFAVCATTVFGLLSKETALVNGLLVPLAALMLAPAIDPEKPQRWSKTIGASIGVVGAGAIYAWIRHKYFFLEIEPEKSYHHATATLEQVRGILGYASTPRPVRTYIDPPLPGLKGLAEKFRVWMGRPNLDPDPFNNPFATKTATDGQRIGGALRVYFRGLGQVVLPARLSPDYSFPQEPLPDKFLSSNRLDAFETILGAILMVAPPLGGLVAWYFAHKNRVRTTLRRDVPGDTFREATVEREVQEKRVFSTELAMFGFCLIAAPVAFFPISNIPVILPTCRAERFWYTPALATAVVFAILFAWLARKYWYQAAVLVVAFLGFQATRARMHANDFSDDLSFWKAAAEAVPNSAKAHLNYSVMLGARAVDMWKWTPTQAQEARLIENKRAAELADERPESWDMAYVYIGDTLCNLNRFDEAWEAYAHGWELAPSNTSLIALGLQCLSDKAVLLNYEDKARELVRKIEAKPGNSNTWLAYLVRDTLTRERRCRGVEHASATPLDVTTDTVGEALEGEQLDPYASASASSLSSLASSAGPTASYLPENASYVPPHTSYLAPHTSYATPSTSYSGSSLPSSSGSASSSGSTSADVTVELPPPPAKAAEAPLPPCGVDPQYRPRGLDGDARGD